MIKRKNVAFVLVMIVVVFASYNVYRTHQSDIISKLMLAKKI